MTSHPRAINIPKTKLLFKNAEYIYIYIYCVCYIPTFSPLGNVQKTKLFVRPHSKETEREKRRCAKKTDAHAALALK